MLCSIEDNGVGRTRDRHNEAQAHHSLGLTVNQERIQRLNEVHGDRFSVTVVDLVDSNGQPTGTRVDVLISTKG
jgi:nitrate/nitrite-specific signal transduction histidine kinase